MYSPSRADDPSLGHPAFLDIFDCIRIICVNNKELSAGRNSRSIHVTMPSHHPLGFFGCGRTELEFLPTFKRTLLTIAFGVAENTYGKYVVYFQLCQLGDDRFEIVDA